MAKQRTREPRALRELHPTARNLTARLVDGTVGGPERHGAHRERDVENMMASETRDVDNAWEGLADLVEVDPEHVPRVHIQDRRH